MARHPGKRRDRPVRKRGRSYGHELLSVLTSVWEAAGYPWSVRLKSAAADLVPWIRKRFKLSPKIEKQTARDQSTADGPSTGRQEEPTEAADLRAHQAGLSAQAPHPGEDRQLGRAVTRLHGSRSGLASGNSGEGEFGYSLNITHIQTPGRRRGRCWEGTNRCAAALDEIEGMLPFQLLGLDSDNGSEFINWHLRLCANGSRSNSREDVRTRRTTTRISSKRIGPTYGNYWAGTL